MHIAQHEESQGGWTQGTMCCWLSCFESIHLQSQHIYMGGKCHSCRWASEPKAHLLWARGAYIRRMHKGMEMNASAHLCRLTHSGTRVGRGPAPKVGRHQGPPHRMESGAGGYSSGIWLASATMMAQSADDDSSSPTLCAPDHRHTPYGEQRLGRSREA